MKTIQLIQALILACTLLLQPTFALAKRKSPPKAYSFIAEGGKASQGECDGERKIPRRLKRLGEFAKGHSYMGSEQIEPEIKGKAGEEMWKHFYRAKPSCNAVLAKTPSSANQPSVKGELPPDEAEEEEETTPAETPEAE